MFNNSLSNSESTWLKSDLNGVYYIHNQSVHRSIGLSQNVKMVKIFRYQVIAVDLSVIYG